MKLAIRFEELDGWPAPSEELERVIQRALEGHASRIRFVRVRLRPSPPMQGAARLGCHVRLRLRGGRTFAVEEFSESAVEAAGGAAWRIAQRIDRDRALAATRPRDAFARSSIA